MERPVQDTVGGYAVPIDPMDMMQCDLSIKKQQKVTLDSIYYFMQGAVAAANNCAIDTATKLYIKADKMLDNFVKNNCNCSGNNY